jgi:hypothetical protein
MKRLGLAAFLLVALLPFAAWPIDAREQILVKVIQDGQAISVEVDCPVDAPWPVIWEVLTDYDRMAEFLSNVSASSIVSRVRDDVIRVRQQGSASIGPLSLPFDNVREIELVPHSQIRSRMVSGDFKASSFVTRIVLVEGRIHIMNSGRYTPNIWVPPLVGPALIEAEMRRQFAEIRTEIRRRSAKARLPGVTDTDGMCASRRTGGMVACNLGSSDRQAPSLQLPLEKETK